MPTLNVLQHRVVYVHPAVPFEENQANGEVGAGGVRELAPWESLDPQAHLAANVFTFEEGGTPARVRIYSAPEGGALMGEIRLDSQQRWQRRALANIHTSSVYVAGVDAQGRETDRVEIQNAETVLSLTPPSDEPSLARVQAVARAGATRDADAAVTSELTVPWDWGSPSLQTSKMLEAVASLGWRRIPFSSPTPPTRTDAAVAYDEARGVVVVFSGRGTAGLLTDLWEWDGSAWARRQPAGSTPPAREGAAAAYHPGAGGVVITGGLGQGGPLADAWLWDGTGWRPWDVSDDVMVTQGRWHHAMAYDVDRGVLTVVGGRDALGLLGGGTFAPAPAERPALVYDEARRQLVLFGGGGALGALDGQWVLVDGNWRLVEAEPRPSARWGHAMAYDPHRRVVLLVGGRNSDGPTNDSWAWDGERWTPHPVDASVASRWGHRIAVDRARGTVLVVGGVDPQGEPTASDWLRGGVHERWSSLEPSDAPPVKDHLAMAYDAARGVVVIFGGLDEGGTPVDSTLEWDGTALRPVTPSQPGPAPRSDHAMAFSAVDGRVLLFGGLTSNGADADLWEWDGSTWTQLTINGTGPSARSGHAMAYDGMRQVMVLHGGADASNMPLDDTWEWDGSGWTDVTPTDTRPTARSGHAMAFDSHRGVSVLVGGSDGAPLRDVWHWNGGSWVQVTADIPLPARVGLNAVSLGEPGTVVTAFGFDGVAPVDEVWFGAGAQWITARGGALQPAARSFAGMAFDAARARAVLLGGAADDALWELDSGPAAPAVQVAVALSRILGAEPTSRLTIRAVCGGTGIDGAMGASLEAWSARPANGAPGGWVPLGTSTLAGTLDGTGAERDAFTTWTTSSAEELSPLLSSGQLTVRCMGPAATVSGASTSNVRLHDLEIRVRH